MSQRPRRRRLELTAVGRLVAERYPQFEWYTAEHAAVGYVADSGRYMAELDATTATAKLTVSLDCPGLLAAHLVADLYALPYKVVVASRPMIHTQGGTVLYDDAAVKYWQSYQMFMYAPGGLPVGRLS